MQFHQKTDWTTWQYIWDSPSNTALVEAVFFKYNMRLNGGIMRRNGNLETLHAKHADFIEFQHGIRGGWNNKHLGKLSYFTNLNLAAMSGDDFPEINHDSSYNLPRNMGISGHQIIWVYLGWNSPGKNSRHALTKVIKCTIHAWVLFPIVIFPSII